MAAEEDDFERPLRELEKRIEELSGVPGGDDRADEIERLDRRLQALRQEVYAHLTPWQRALVARHPKRPYTLDYVNLLFSDFVEIHGDRKYADDPAIAVGDRVLMLEHAVYSVISPEGCAAILWSDQGKAKEAARAMRITEPDLRELEIIDAIVPEPPGGAQADHTRQAAILDDHLMAALEELRSVLPVERVEARYQKFRRMGTFGQAKFF